jgi:hypothetical protein
MLFLFLPMTLLATATLALPAEAASPRHNRHRDLAKPDSYHARPYWQGTPQDRLPIWRYGYYQGNDSDNFIRLQLMRDPPNHGYW